jgi:hypothetical protein
MLGDFEDESVFGSFDFQRVQNWWEFSFELNIDNGTNNLGNFAISDRDTLKY